MTLPAPHTPEQEIILPISYKTRPEHYPTLQTLSFSALMAGFLAIFGLTLWLTAHPDPRSSMHYAPTEDLERIDVAAIDTARRRIDLAAYVLTDAPVIAALSRAAQRGVAVRVLFDRGQLEQRPETPQLISLQDVPGVSVRVKHGHVYMHLKAYAIDGGLLRTGSANFSVSGLKRQDNDLVLIETSEAVRTFEKDFERMWNESEMQ